MVSKLADFCRRTRSRGGDEMVSVSDEIEMARSYLEIEQVRWQEGLIVRIEIEPRSLACLLPQILLLPLLENAIKYGGRTFPGTLEVSIEITPTENQLHCVFAHTSRWIKSTDTPFDDSTHIGLRNLRQRLRRHRRSRVRQIRRHHPLCPGQPNRLRQQRRKLHQSATHRWFPPSRPSPVEVLGIDPANFRFRPYPPPVFGELKSRESHRPFRTGPG